MYSVSKLDPNLNPEPLLLQTPGVPQEVQVQGSCDYPRAACLSVFLWEGANPRTREGTRLPTGMELGSKVEARQLSSQDVGTREHQSQNRAAVGV